MEVRSSGGCNTFMGFSTERRRGALVLSNFLWRPIDSGTINIGMKMIDPDFPTGRLSCTLRIVRTPGMRRVDGHPAESGMRLD